ncbi:MAG: CoA transferase [Dehalococcoidia bacterium]|nr:CoA transferase [Dehalococcoidia bacterium]
MSEQALSDVKVVDLTHHVAGPYCTKLLADYGAEVIKIERPGAGDPARQMGPFYQDDPHPEKSGLFLHLNTNKKSLTLNLQTATGKSALLELVKDADILVENFRPGVLEELGLDYQTLSKVNPQLIMTSISNFGQTGPYRDYKSTEMISFGMGGIMFRHGEPDREPLKYAGVVLQCFAGLNGAAATMCAYMGAMLGGPGQYLDISIMECLAGAVDRQILRYSYTGEVAERVGSRREGNYPSGIYPCGDGFVHVATLGIRGWPRVAKMLEMPELVTDPMFATAAARRLHHDDFEVFFYPWLLERNKMEVFHAAEAERVMSGPVYSIDELFTDPHYQARKMFTEIDHPVTGPLTYPAAPFKMSESPWQGKRAPLLGEHNQEILGERLGYSPEDLVKLRETGVI